MVNKRRLLVNSVFLASLILLLNCAEPDGKLGGSVINPEVTGEVRDSLFYPVTAGAYGNFQSPSGTSLHLYLGKGEEYEARFLVKFDNFYNLPDSFDFVSAEMVLYGGAIYGDSTVSYPDFEGYIYKDPELVYSNNWNEYWVTWDSLYYPSGTLKDTFIVSKWRGDSIVVPIDTNWIRDWIDEYEWSADTTTWDTIAPVNSGLLFDFNPSAEFIKDFHSSENADSIKPRLVCHLTVYDTSGVVSSDSVMVIYASNDIYIAKDNALLPGDRLYIGRSDGYRGMLLMDPSTVLPQFGVFINRATFTFFIDTASVFYTGALGNITADRMTDTLWISNPAEYNIDATYQGSLAYISGDSVTLSITNMLFDWVIHPDENFGMSLRFDQEGVDLTRAPIFPHDCPDLTKRPYVYVVYTTAEGAGDE